MPLSHRVTPQALQGVALSRSCRTWPRSRNIATAPSVDHIHDAFIPPPQSQQTRQESVRNAAPFSAFLTDSHARQHNYLRISLTERCNLRCTYCMPSEGVLLSQDRDILTTPEIVYLSALFVNQGVTKIRLTGGEPTVRKDILPLMQQIGALRRNGLKELALTTNGISLHRKLEGMVEAGLTGVNISLDTLDPLQFPLLTRRNGFEAVMRSIERVKDLNRAGAGIKLKINIVAMNGVNDDQIIPFVAMTETEDLEVRFIEYMPFGGNKWSRKKMLPYENIREKIQEKWPTFQRMKDERNAVSKTWKVPGFVGRVGFITSMTEDFCGTCNRLRITSDGNLKVCLHGNTEVSLRDLLRAEGEGEPMDEVAFDALRQLESQRRGNGDEGWITKERQLLDVIGAAVKRKKAKHAGMGELENMENRPMILIGKRKAASLSRPSLPQHLLWSSSSLYESNPWSRIPLNFLPPSSLQGYARFYSNKADDAVTKTHDFFEQPADEQLSSGSKPITPAAGRNEAFATDKSSDEAAVEAPCSISTHESGQSTAQVPETSTGGTVASENESLQSARTTAGQFTAAIASSPSSPTFGFQSLSGLLPRPKSAARPAEKHRSVQQDKLERRETPFSLSRNSWDKTADAKEDWRSSPTSMEELRPAQDFGRQSTSPGSEELTIADSYMRNETPNMTYAVPESSRSSRRRSDEPVITKISDKVKKTPFRPPQGGPRRLQNPFESSAALSRNHLREGSDSKRGKPQGLVQTQAENPWGLSKEDTISLEYVLQPGSQKGARDSTLSTTSALSADRSTNAAKSIGSSTDSARSRGETKLTHLTSSGEAHMVDIGAKKATRRVAVAFGSVRFSNPEAARLIQENSNRKGDVLGVARIAGIMAAKRTSDLIPLCHPIALTKVEVDLRLHGTGEDLKGLLQVGKGGSVSIQTLVECTGPTGVEMEALSALSGAALTIYDMCKSVDKKMAIASARVVYKSGGRSGDLCWQRWLTAVGTDFFTDHGLQWPGSESLDGAKAPSEVKKKGEHSSQDHAENVEK